MKRYLLLQITLLALLFSCAPKEENPFDASGTFEAEEVIISSEASGKIMQLDIEEGQTLKAGQIIGYIDSTQLFLQRKQLQAMMKANRKRLPSVAPQAEVYDQQEAALQTRLANLAKEQKRFENLVAAEAATPKQLDDINAQVDEAKAQLLVIDKQKKAQVSALGTQSSSLGGELLPLKVQVEQINEQLKKCQLTNPTAGTVLSQYAEPNEMTAIGKPLYKIADLSSINLRAYITGQQLPLIKLNQKVTVHTDDGKGGYNQTTGTITRISDKAEFTPKTIQTKEERANMVYAIKVKVKNDGSFKIGMYGEILFE